MRPRIESALVTLAVLAASRGARADARSSSLSWVRLAGADGCVSTQDLARDVEERLGRAVFVSAAQADVSVEGHIEPNKSGPGFHASISIRDAHGALLGTREIARNEASCDSLRAPLALIVATMIDPEATLHKKDPASSPPSPPAPIVNPPEKQAPEVIIKKETVYVEVPVEKKSAPPPTKLSIEVDAAFTAAYGLLPGPAFGAHVTSLIQLPDLRLGSSGVPVPMIEYSVSYFGGTSATAENGSAHASFSLAYGGIGGCLFHLRSARAALHGCGELDLGALFEHPVGFGNEKDDVRFFIAGEVELRATLRIAGPFVALLSLKGLVPFVRNTYVYDASDGQHPLWQASAVAGAASVGLGAIF